MDEVEAAMHMVRPGPGAKRWSAESDRLMVPRMKDALQGRFRELGKAGVWRYDEEWAKAFVKEEWDGLPPVAEEEEEQEQDDAAAELDALAPEFDALSFGDLRDLMLEAAGNLFDFKVHLDFLDHGVTHAGAGERAEAEAMRDRCLEELRVLEGALDRAAVRELGIREVGGAKAPPMGAIWERLLGGVVHDAN
ncbi:hypothetical protein K4K54_001989 [Colletotrichum sp. SAR 10_86]|nr:hypothetical protein KHU50_006038 [Colletotrichum sp. SAR 10_65]KAI8213421.1 hypothetical protein K4K52_005122 [Colletotrichum sp. SAR 10_76]KAI8236818.1 hypothetical protein K4K54_001989 [Colletotrichum sp. SAR 10_86]